MQTVLGWFATASTRAPRRVLVGLLLVTIALGLAASTNQVEVDLTEFGLEDSSAVHAMDRVRDDFRDPDAAVQVILDAGPGGDVLTAEGFEVLRQAEAQAVEALGPAAFQTSDGRTPTVSLRSVVGAMAAQQGLQPSDLDAAMFADAVTRMAGRNPQVAGLLSDDADLDAGSARATLVVLPLDPELSESERAAAAERVQDAVADAAIGTSEDVRVTVFSNGLFVAGLVDAIRAEVPRLFGLALLVVLGLLAVMYRSVFDVAVGLMGLLATVVWTFGVVGLLGPANLGLVGPLTQLAVMVPVLLVGLGIDYSVHLTARYREQRAAGQAPAVAAERALRTVGAALLLSTVATAIGFGSIATAPLAMVADFGIFVAIGVVCAVVVMGLLVPAARVLRDGTNHPTHPRPVRELGLGRVLRGPTRLAVSRPGTGLAVAGVLLVGAVMAATQLAVAFDRDDFVPEGSAVAAVLAHQDELFGGGVTESTFVLVEGNLADVDVANAMWTSQRALASIDGIRTIGGTPQVQSVWTFAADLPGSPLRPAAGFPDEADLPGLLDRLRTIRGDHQVAALLASDASAGIVQIRTTAGDAGAEALRRDVEAAFEPVTRAGAEVTVTSGSIVIAEMSDALASFQLRAIGLTLAVVLVLLVATYGRARRPLLGVIAMLPATVSAALVLFTMWALGISFNVLTATLTAIAVGIGVPYGVHVVNRFVEDLADAEVVAADAAQAADTAITRTLASTGGALAGSAATTLGAFVILAFSGLPPIRSLGLLGGAAIVFSLLAAILVQPGALVLWARGRASSPT